MTKFSTREFDTIEYVPAGSKLVQEKIKRILAASEDWTANINHIESASGTYQIVLQGRLKQSPAKCS
ncbi:MAG: hypothetical protein ONB16_02910 [candidate division KSB1 bacterium]|nr:hypothetical protein [candidate division KSB1 bacterium]MDZ7318419.1 hypothetical protein [candidate division KSB1 bacterium]MDZ7341249.1 hypothetical protein [candidate division KSB1 bacterium]